MRPHARANALLQSDDEESVQEVVGAVSELHEDADDDGIIFDAPVRGSESMEVSNGDVLEAIASTSRATRLHKRVVQSTPYQRVQALLGQRAPAPATRTRGRPAMGDYEALSSVRCKPHAQTACARAALARSLLCYACAN